MKKLNFFFLISLMLSIIGSVKAQDILIVEPGLGTLNDAINTYGGDKIYQLTAGSWYGLTERIENDGYHLQIIGSEPAEEGGMPATLQTGSDGSGAVFEQMFNVNGNITFKNIYFVNADLMGQTGDVFLVQGAQNARTIIDCCVIHPVGVSAGFKATGGNTKTYFTNNLVVNQGHMNSPNDGFVFTYSDATSALDTLVVENNTFVAMGTCLFNTGYALYQDNNFVNWNHNTFVMTKSQIDWSVYEKEFYWTNNLMFDLQTQPYFTNWQPMPGADPSMPKPNLIYAAPIPDEEIPSSRPCFVEYNSHYRAQGFYDFIDNELNPYCEENNLPQAYLFDLVWPADTLTCREAQMFNSTDFPEFKYGNTIKNVDPKWNDSKIYEHEAKLIEWTKPATWIHGVGLSSDNYPATSEWAQWHWTPSGDLSDNSVWPLFDGTYTDETTLTGSIEVNIPLGDLNWFPEAKAAWEVNKEEIEAHIRAGNTDQIDIGYASTATIRNEFSQKPFKMYPNPAKNALYFEMNAAAEITISSIDGHIIKTVSNVSTINISELEAGIYIATVNDRTKVSSQMFIKK